MKRFSVSILVFALIAVQIPRPALAQSDTGLASSKAGDAVVLEYEEGRIEWNVIASQGGTVDHSLRVEVPGDGVQLIVGITGPHDLTEPLEGVTLDVRDPRGTRIGDADTTLEAVRLLGLNPMPALPPSVLQDLPKGELKEASHAIATTLATADNAGLVHVPATRFEDRGIQALHLFNPSQEGTWTVTVEGRDSQPFVAVALVLPIAPTDAERAAIQRAAVNVGGEVARSMPGLTASASDCSTCSNIVAVSGIVATLVGVIAGILTAGAGAEATLVVYLGAVAVALGAGSVGAEVAAGLIIQVMKKDFFCGLAHMGEVICFGFHKCPLPC